MSIGPDASIASDTDGESRGKGREPAGEAGSEVGVTLVPRVAVDVDFCGLEVVKKVLTFLLQDDPHNESIDTKDTSHNNWNNGPENEVGSGDAHGADSHA